MQTFHVLLHRAVLAATTWPGPIGWVVTGLLMLVLWAVAVSLNRRTGFLYTGRAVLPVGLKAGFVSAAFFSPALAEEVLFRALPIPRMNSEARMLWALGSLIAFIFYHPMKTWVWTTSHNQVFTNGHFLILAGLLGLACTIAYLLTDSLWPSVIIHWLAVSVWLFLLGGYDRMYENRRTMDESERR